MVAPGQMLLLCISSFIAAAGGYGTMMATHVLKGKYATCNYELPSSSCRTACCIIDGSCEDYSCKLFGYGVNMLESCNSSTCPQYHCALFHNACASQPGAHCFGLVHCDPSKGPCDLLDNLCLQNAGTSDFLLCPSDCDTDADCPTGSICVLNNFLNGYQVRYCQAMCPNVTISHSVEGSISAFYPWTADVTCLPGFTGGGEAVCLPSGEWQMPLPTCTPESSGTVAGGSGCADAAAPQGSCCGYPLTHTFISAGSVELYDICMPLANDTYCSFPNLTHNQLWVRVDIPSASPTGWWWVGAKACGAQCHACQTPPCAAACECEAVVSVFNGCASWQHTRPQCDGIVTQRSNITLGLTVLPTSGATAGGCCISVTISASPWSSCNPPKPCCSA